MSARASPYPPAPPDASNSLTYPPSWYPDPWGIAPLRWWDGRQWTPIIYGPYGEAWPLHAPAPPFVPKGPGIKGGGIAAVGAGIGMVASLVVGAFYIVGASPSATSLAQDPWFLLWTQLTLWFGFVGAVLVASRRNGTSSLKADYGLSVPGIKDMWLGLAGAVVGRFLPLLVLISLVLAGSGFGTPNSASHAVLGVTPSGAAAWAIVVSLTVVGAPLVEELFFRGLLQGAFTRRLGPVPAIFVTAVIFCFAHVLSDGPVAPVGLFPVAVVLGYLRYRTGRLAAGMIAHATFNASLFLLFLIPAFR